MKIAVFHNFLDNIGGAEIVGLTLARELGADVYTTNIDQEKINKMGFSNIPIFSIGRIPINAPFKQQAALFRFRQLNLRRKYDFYIIDGDWAMSGSVHNKPNLWYIHSPIREIWDLYHYIRQNTVPWYGRWVYDIWTHINRHLNKKYAQHVNAFVCNSKNTRQRVKRYLNKEAVIIHPPIETNKFHFKKSGDFWLSVNRLFVHKRVDMQLKAFRELPDEKLVVVGSYEKSAHFQAYAKYIKSLKPANVDIVSWISQEELIDLYANCKGFIATAQDEDFGMTLIEAMASGKPVIAADEGGYRETVIDGETGKLIKNIDEQKLKEAVTEVGRDPLKYKDACLRHAKNFDTQIFINKIRSCILSI